jgi:hypothetical protein
MVKIVFMLVDKPKRIAFTGLIISMLFKRIQTQDIGENYQTGAL